MVPGFYLQESALYGIIAQISAIGASQDVSFLRNVNGYLLEHPKLLLTLMWVFVLLAVIPGILLATLVPQMGYFKFMGIIIVPALIALYLRILYSKVQEKRKKERLAQKAEENQARYQHKKKH